DAEAIDKNYAANLPVLDMLFGTYIDNRGRWPQRYGVVGKPLPHGFLAQHLYSFIAPPKALIAALTAEMVICLGSQHDARFRFPEPRIVEIRLRLHPVGGDFVRERLALQAGAPPPGRRAPPPSARELPPSGYAKRAVTSPLCSGARSRPCEGETIGGGKLVRSSATSSSAPASTIARSSVSLSSRIRASIPAGRFRPRSAATARSETSSCICAPGPRSGGTP